MSFEEVQKLKAIPPKGNCHVCGGYHDFTCPYIAEIEENGKREVFRREMLSLAPFIVYDSDVAEAEEWYRRHSQPKASEA